jgi:hypothetical protein
MCSCLERAVEVEELVVEEGSEVEAGSVAAVEAVEVAAVTAEAEGLEAAVTEVVAMVGKDSVEAAQEVGVTVVEDSVAVEAGSVGSAAAEGTAATMAETPRSSLHRWWWPLE